MLVAAGPIVNHLDATSPGLFQENVFWFQVTVDDSVPIKCIQTLQNGVGKLAYKSKAESLEPVFLDQLVEVHAQ